MAGNSTDDTGKEAISIADLAGLVTSATTWPKWPE